MSTTREASLLILLILSSIKMPGMIVPNVPPAIQLTQPIRGGAFPEGTPILMRANAADSDGSITAVEFYADTNLLGRILEFPYQLTVTNLLRGTNNLFAIAIDDAGARTSTRTMQAIVVVPPPPQATELCMLAMGSAKSSRSPARIPWPIQPGQCSHAMLFTRGELPSGASGFNLPIHYIKWKLR